MSQLGRLIQMVWLMTVLLGCSILLTSAGRSKPQQPIIEDVNGVFPLPISSYSAGGQYAMITFDGGPHHLLTASALDILREHNSKATFFVQGVKSFEHPSLLQRMAAEGHEIALSGWSYESLLDMPLSSISSSFLKARAAIPASLNSTNLIPVRGKLGKSGIIHARPPFGLTNSTINKHIAVDLGFQVILWSIDSHDLEVKTAQEIVEEVVSKLKPGDIILCHDSSPAVTEYLPLLLKALHNKFYELLTVATMRSFPDDKPH